MAIIAGLGKYDPGTKKGVPEDSVINYWVYEYQGVANTAYEKLDNIRGDFNDILDDNFQFIEIALDDGQNVVSDLQKNLDEIKVSIKAPIIDNSESMEQYRKLVFKLILNVLALINIVFAFRCFYSFYLPLLRKNLKNLLLLL